LVARLRDEEKHELIYGVAIVKFDSLIKEKSKLHHICIFKLTENTNKIAFHFDQDV